MRNVPAIPVAALALGEAEARTGRTEAADARFEALLRRLAAQPRGRADLCPRARRAQHPRGRPRAQAVLRPLLARAADDAVFQQHLRARQRDRRRRRARRRGATPKRPYLNGRPEQALVQLNTLKKRPDLDYYARARIEARIAAITPTVLELKRQGIRDEDLRRR